MAVAFSSTLAKLRQAKGVSQRKAAADLGVSQALLSHYENGIREPGLEFLCRACDYYQVSSDYMLGRSGRKTDQAGMPMRTEANSAEFELDELTEIDRRLLSDCISMIGQILSEVGSRQLVNDAFACFSLAVFRLIRELAPQEADKLADIGGANIELAAETAVKCAELGIVRRLEEAEYSPVRDLDEKYPELYQSLMQVLYCAGMRIKKI